MAILRHLPNLITLVNLLCGMLSILSFSMGMIQAAGIFVFAAALADFLDGFAARLLKAYSAIGADLDSLADVVSFGVAPGMILYHLISISHGRPAMHIGSFDLVPLTALLLPLFAALRLAKFNNDPLQTDYFRGLPSPAAGLFVASLPLIRQQLYESQSLTYMVFTNAYFLMGTAIVLGLLMVSNLPLFGLKFKHFRIRGNEIRYFFLLVAALLIGFLQFLAIPAIIATYLVLSLFVYLAEIQS
ncbi:MAG TPA: CDP-diacylglycerol--serine O-phosphatidyltransferase [Bacteroidales bacterium]|nr:CDP-diacylglycerol--serine O-phosphatidyltransferase [Bacteroidales bacterium]